MSGNVNKPKNSDDDDDDDYDDDDDDLYLPELRGLDGPGGERDQCARGHHAGGGHHQE